MAFVVWHISEMTNFVALLLAVCMLYLAPRAHSYAGMDIRLRYGSFSNVINRLLLSTLPPYISTSTRNISLENVVQNTIYKQPYLTKRASRSQLALHLSQVPLHE